MTASQWIDGGAAARTAESIETLGLLSGEERREVAALFDSGFVFADVVAAATSIHVHVKVADVDALAHDAILELGGVPASRTDGYLKYRFACGVNMIFSSIPIAEDDLLDPPEPTAVPGLPVLDHVDIDLRRTSPEVRRLFDSLPERAAAHGWRHRAQGDAATPVFCCHTQVAEKHWLYPGDRDGGRIHPIEVAFGELIVQDTKRGCDLRPTDPAHPRAAAANAPLAACASGHGTDTGCTDAGSSCDERVDVARCGDAVQSVGPGAAATTSA